MLLKLIKILDRDYMRDYNDFIKLSKLDSIMEYQID